MNYTIKSSYLIVGSVSTGKSALAHYLLETYGGKYQLTPTVVVLPKNKQVYAHFLEVEKPALKPP